MNDQTTPTLDEIYKLTKDNNRMLHAMRRQAFMKDVLGFIWWLFFFLVLPYLTFLFFKPYIDQMTALYGQLESQADTVNAGVKGLPDVSKLIEQFTGGPK